VTSRHSWLLFLGTAAMVLSLSACNQDAAPPPSLPAGRPEQAPKQAVLPPSASPSVLDEATVRASATAYLEAIRLNDLATAYRMEFGSQDGSLSPLGFRDILPRGVLLSYAITSVTLVDGEAIVEADVSYQLPQLRKPYQTKRQMRWLAEEGKLYHRGKPPQQELGQALAPAPQAPGESPKPIKREAPKPLPWEANPTSPN
jgi:hypothetical protein